MKYLILSACLLFAVNIHAQVSHTPDSVSDGKIYTHIDQMPTCPFDLPTYLSENLHYPNKARKKNIEGRVVIKFVVNEDGHISDCEVTKSVDDDLDNEALRVVKKMPAWKPGIIDGKAVKVYFHLPIVYKLED